MEKGSAALRRPVALGRALGRDPDLNLVAELSGSTGGSWISYRLLIMTLLTVSAFVVICYSQAGGREDVTEDGNNTDSARDSTHMVLLEDVYVQENSATEEVSNATAQEISSLQRMEASLSRLVNILDDIDARLDGRDLSESHDGMPLTDFRADEERISDGFGLRSEGVPDAGAHFAKVIQGIKEGSSQDGSQADAVSKSNRSQAASADEAGSQLPRRPVSASPDMIPESNEQRTTAPVDQPVMQFPSRTLSLRPIQLPEDAVETAGISVDHPVSQHPSRTLSLKTHVSLKRDSKAAAAPVDHSVTQRPSRSLSVVPQPSIKLSGAWKRKQPNVSRRASHDAVPVGRSVKRNPSRPMGLGSYLSPKMFLIRLDEAIAVMQRLRREVETGEVELRQGWWNTSSSAGVSTNFTDFAKSLQYFRRLQDRNLHRKKTFAVRKQRRRLVHSNEPKPLSKSVSAHAGLWLFGFLLILVFAVSMVPGFGRGHHGHQNQHPRQHAHVGDAGPPYVGTSTLKVPPAWSVERNHSYSLRSWVSDLILWATATDIEPQRQGAIAAMQVTGSAKELVREIPPEQLAQGVWDPQAGQQITGLMLLVRTLARRYSPLDGEVSTRAVSDFLNFDRIPGESTDAFLVRFDVLRNRALVRGGLGVNPQGLSWLLLRALGVNADQLDRLLQPLNGNLPNDEPELTQLLERIRRQGHLYEGAMRHPNQQAGAGDPGTYHYFPTFSAETPFGACGTACGSNPGSAYAGGAGVYASNVAEDISQYVGGNAAYHGSALSENQCHTCGSYFDDCEFSSATESDNGSIDEEMLSYQVVDVDGEQRSDVNSRSNALFQDYMAARRRWRRYTGKPPRRYRRVNFRSDRNYQKLRSGPYSRSYASFLAPSAFAGGKGGSGKGKGAGLHKGFPRKNPRGRDGQVLKCSKCGSEEHLWRKCPHVAGNGATQGTSSAAHVTMHTAAASASSAMCSAKSPGVETWHSGALAGAMPGISFHYIAGSSPPRSETGSQVGSAITGAYKTAASALDEDLARLESVSQIGSERSLRSHRPARNPPSWDAAEPASVSQPATSSEFEGQVEALRPGAPTPKHPPPAARGPTQQDLERQKTVLQLSSMLMAWWEVDSPESVSGDGLSEMSAREAYHLRTRLGGDRVGLLVDPRPLNNLVGSRTADRMVQMLGVPSRTLRMDKALQVEGVGKSAQSASTARKMALRLCTDEGTAVNGSYTAPVIADSDLPPLLGLKSLRNFGAILDMSKNQLILPGPASCTITRSPGTQVFDLKLSSSGHLILPIDANMQVSDAQESGLEFQMSCRKPSRSVSPARSAAPVRTSSAVAVDES